MVTDYFLPGKGTCNEPCALELFWTESWLKWLVLLLWSPLKLFTWLPLPFPHPDSSAQAAITRNQTNPPSVSSISACDIGISPKRFNSIVCIKRILMVNTRLMFVVHTNRAYSKSSLRRPLFLWVGPYIMIPQLAAAEWLAIVDCTTILIGSW